MTMTVSPTPPPSTPPNGKLNGRLNRKTIGIVAIPIVGVLALGIGGNWLSASGSEFPKAEYRLTVPESLLGDTYRLSEDLSATSGQEAAQGTVSSDIRDPKPAVARYTGGSASAPTRLLLSGMYGQFKQPARTRARLLRGAEKSVSGSMGVDPAQDITPTGSDVTLSCQVVKRLGENAEWMALPMCAWADGNTAGTVTVITSEPEQPDPQHVDLAQLAETTLKVRAEIRQPLG